MKLACKAFILVLKRRSKTYKQLIQQSEKKYHVKFIYIANNVDAKYFQKLPERFQHIGIPTNMIMLIFFKVFSGSSSLSIFFSVLGMHRKFHC